MCKFTSEHVSIYLLVGMYICGYLNVWASWWVWKCLSAIEKVNVFLFMLICTCEGIWECMYVQDLCMWAHITLSLCWNKRDHVFVSEWMFEHLHTKAMAPHSSTLVLKIPWMEEPGRLQSMGSLRVGHDWATSLSIFTFMHWRRKWQPTPVFLPEESQGRGSLVACHLWGHTESDRTEVT